MKNINWMKKLTSRKFWVSVASFTSMMILATGGTENTATQVTALIMAGASVVAYIIGEWEFYGLTLDVSRDVLIPRMDTEVLAEQAILAARSVEENCRVLDLCTGSGLLHLLGDRRGDRPAEHPASIHAGNAPGGCGAFHMS